MDRSRIRLYIPLHSDATAILLCCIRLILVCALNLPPSVRVFAYLKTHPDAAFQNVRGLAKATFGLVLLSVFLAVLECIPHHLLKRLFPPEENALWTSPGRKARFLILSAALGSILQLATAIAALVAAFLLAGTWQRDPDIARYMSEQVKSSGVWRLDPEEGKAQRAVDDIRKFAIVLMVLSFVGAVAAVSTLLLLRVLPTGWRLPPGSSPFAEPLATELTAGHATSTGISGIPGALGVTGASQRLAEAYDNMPSRQPPHIVPITGRQPATFRGLFAELAAANGGRFRSREQPPVATAIGTSTISFDPALEFWAKPRAAYGAFGNAKRYRAHISLLGVWQLPQAAVQLVRFGKLASQNQLKSCTQYCALSLAPMYIWIPVVLALLLMIRCRVPFQKPLLWKATFENMLVGMAAFACAMSFAALASLGVYVTRRKDDSPDPPDPVFPSNLAYFLYALAVNVVPILCIPFLLCSLSLRIASKGLKAHT